MTPEEIQRTMEFILQSQADSVVRLDQLHEAQRQSQAEIASLTAGARDLLEVSRRHEERIGRLDNLATILTQLADHQSKRLDRLEG